MISKESEARGEDTPAIDGLPTVYSNAPQLYIKDGLYIDKDFEALQQNPLIQDFANVNEDTYALVAATNPTLKLLFDVCKSIVLEGGHEL